MKRFLIFAFAILWSAGCFKPTGNNLANDPQGVGNPGDCQSQCANGAVTQTCYDSAGTVISTTTTLCPNDEVCDPTTNACAGSAPDGGLDCVTACATNGGAVTQTCYDSAGNVVSTTTTPCQNNEACDPTTNACSGSAADGGLDCVTACANGAVAQICYDASGAVVSSTTSACPVGEVCDPTVNACAASPADGGFDCATSCANNAVTQTCIDSAGNVVSTTTTPCPSGQVCDPTTATCG